MFCSIFQIFRKLFCKKKLILYERLQEFGHMIWLIHGLKVSP